MSKASQRRIQRIEAKLAHERELLDRLEENQSALYEQLGFTDNAAERNNLERQIEALDPKIEAALARCEATESQLLALTESSIEPKDPQGEQSTPKKRIFLSYKRDVDPDQTIALAVHQALSQHHTVFIDQTMLVGTQWVECIEREIRQADVLIVLLSAASVRSEMVTAEVALAHQLNQEKGRPLILPVRLDYREPFQYPLSAYLNGINWAFWQGAEDTPALIADLQQAIAGGELAVASEQAKAQLLQSNPSLLPPPSPVAQPLTLELPEGTMDPESRFYIERRSDGRVMAAIQRQGVTIPIKGPRQMGKSSLLNRVLQVARSQDKRTVFLDFQLFDKATLARSELFYQRFCRWLTLKLRLSDRVEEWWQLYGQIGNSLCCTLYFQDYLLPEANNAVMLAMDEVESVFGSAFRSEFFAMLRSWHNSRASEPIWKQLDLVLVTSTEPYQLIQDINQSPFNVGEVVELEDFSNEQVADLNQRHGSPLNELQQRQVMHQVQGHPYLVRRALYLLASGNLGVSELFNTAAAERGPFGDHLRYHLFRLYDQKPLVQGLLQAIRQQCCPDERVFFRLRGAGLVRRQEQKVLPRCPLYATYFQEHLHD